jgi:ribonucleoside-diphosphate reductase alpha chain
VTQLSDNAMDLLKKRYFRPNENTWEDLCNRVCEGIVQAEDKENQAKWLEVFYNMMSNMEFIVGTPCLINGDKSNKGQLSSCFIIEIKDNIESIYQAKGECAKIFQKNGGVGFNISTLRPEGTNVETSNGYSCGTIGFMEEFDLTADVVTRNNIRKGAIKIDLNDWHPDILKFIKCKQDTSKLTHMNISVSLSDNFMNAVKNNDDWNLIFPDYSFNKNIYNNEWDGNIEQWVSKGYPIKVYKTLKAKELYTMIMESAWKTGEPGVSYPDTMDRYNPNPHMGTVNSTNPCAEFCSIPYNSCNLGSINLVTCIIDNQFSWDKFKTLIINSIRFLDNMITVNKLPLPKIDEVTKSVRSLGLGIMGLADCLYLLKIPYNKSEGYKFIEKLFAFMRETAEQYSIKLAKEKGVYPAYEGSNWEKLKIRVRNSNFLSIAPTGSISFLANVSSGLEPVYSLIFSRRTNEGDIYYITNPIFEQELKSRNLYSKEILKKITDNKGSCIGIKEIPKDIQEIFVTASDISPQCHTDVVGIIQKYVDLAASKTINLPNSATVKDIEEIYMYAWELGCKGVTVYRDGCRENQTLATSREESSKEVTEFPRGYIEEVPEDLTYRKYKLQTGCGSLYFFLGVDVDDGRIYDCFTNTDGVGGCTVNTQSNSRLLSAGLRGGVPVEYLIKQLEKAGSCSSYQQVKGKQQGIIKVKNIVDKYIPEDILNQINDLIGIPLSQGKSCASAIANVLKNVLKELADTEHENIPYQIAEKDEIPHVCKHENMRMVEGCKTCPDCGYSKCN